MTTAEKLHRAAQDLLWFVKYSVTIQNKDEYDRVIELANTLEKSLKEFDEQP